MSVPSEIYQRFHQELAERFQPLGWRYVKSGPCLKKKVKDIEFSISMGASWHNSQFSSRVRVAVWGYCKSISKKDCPASSMLWFRLAPSDGQDSEWWELITPEGYHYALEDVTSLLEKTILPVVKSFEEDYEKAARELALKGYSSPLMVCRPVSHICFANVRFTSHLFGDALGQQSARNQYALMSELTKKWVKNQMQTYLSQMEKAKWYLSVNGGYLVNADIMYMVDHKMIALSPDDEVIFPPLEPSEK